MSVEHGSVHSEQRAAAAINHQGGKRHDVVRLDWRRISCGTADDSMVVERTDETDALTRVGKKGEVGWDYGQTRERSPKWYTVARGDEPLNCNNNFKLMAEWLSAGLKL